MSVLRMNYVHARVTDLEDAKSRHGSTMGLLLAAGEPGGVYHRGWDEWDHHSVGLEYGWVGHVKIGYKVPTAVTSSSTRAEQSGAGAVDERRGEP